MSEIKKPKKYINYKFVGCDEKQFKNVLKYLTDPTKILTLTKIETKSPMDQNSCWFNAYYKVDKTKVHIWCKRKDLGKDSGYYHYIFRLDGDETIITNGKVAYATLKKYAPNIPDLTTDPFYGYKQLDDGNYVWSDSISLCSAVIGFNEKLTNNRYHDCYGYDINSAFTFAMLNDMPDTSKHPREFDYVKDGEIGFDYDDDGNFTCLTKGHYARFIYPLMPTPFKRFADVWYNKKKNAKTPEDKQKAKNILTHSVGYLQRKNPFLRAAIIYYSNQYIQSFIDENTLYWNTDSIVSKTRREDIEKNIGTELGQWKLEHTGDFAYKGLNYQWNKDVPPIRGIPKKWFAQGFDILKDEVPSQGNIYELDETKADQNKLVLRRVKNEIQSKKESK